MKDILRSLKENATSRLKNPIVGAFMLTWMILHINGVALFVLGDTDTKVEIVKNKIWIISDDVLIPFIASLGYLIFVPLLTMGYEYINDGVINFKRSSRKYGLEKDLAIKKKQTVIAQVETDVNYIQKLKEKEIDKWIAEKQKINKEFISLKERYASLVNESSENQRKYLKELSKVKLDMNEIEKSSKKFEGEIEVNRKKVELATDRLEKLIKNLESNGISSQRDELKLSREIINRLRADINIWDDDIPF
ncbi:hypothetical protein [Vibrio tritonius]|uniref:hypothetical protein n=1 Tax=Vibrio tritonius TaxID=1435069 RepID=UPI00315CBFB0